MKNRLFVDMDGTLAEFKTVDTLETLYEENYFLCLRPQKNVVNAIRELVTSEPDIEVFILSSVLPDSKYALKEKNLWLDAYLPQIDYEHRLYPPCGSDKREYVASSYGGVSERDYLLDDYSLNLHSWVSPARGIKLLNGNNGTRGTWQFDCISAEKSGEVLADNIRSIVLHGEHIRDKVRDKEAIERRSDIEKNAKLESSVPADNGKPPEKSHRERLQKRYLGGGISVMRLCAQDAKLLQGNGIGEDEVLNDVLNGKFDLTGTVGAMESMTFEQEPDWIQGYKDKLRYFFRQTGLMTFQAFEHGDVSRADFEKVIYGELARYQLEREKAGPVCASFMRDILSYGKLDGLIQSRDISDIRLMDRNTVNVQYHGVWYRTNVAFATEDEYVSFITRMCTINHAMVNIREADRVFTDIHTFPGYVLRITVTHSLLSTAATYSAHIRISPRRKKTAEELISERFWSREQAAFLTTAVKKKKSLIICGGSGSGKTILLNLLIESMAPDICGTCIQDSDELHSEHHPNIEFLHSVTARGEGGVEYSLKRIATKALLKNAEAFIIGEIKGDEATDFFTASRTSRVYATTHADDCFGALPRLSELAKYNADYSQADILRILSKNIDYVVYCEKYRVSQIAGVVGYDRERDDVVYDLYEFDDAEEGKK